jgi:hypothetical protein
MLKQFSAAIGVMALAMAGAAVAGPGKGQGGGGGGGHKGGGGQAMHAGGGGQAKHGGGGGQVKHGGGAMRKHVGGGQKLHRQTSDRQAARSNERRDKQARVTRDQADRGKASQRTSNVRQADRARLNGRVNSGVFAQAGTSRGLVNGCPPGLAAKNNGCLPPGQAKRLLGATLPAALGASLLPATYRSWYPDTDDYFYRAQDNYLLRVNRDNNLIDGLLPLSGVGYYPVGQAYPQEYDFYNVPSQYASYYPDRGDTAYRYGEGAIYQVNRSNGLIGGIAQLLAGDLAVGSQLPAGYDVYNVPLDYRDRYADGPDSLYRYNDGYIYQVDPKTRLIEAVIQALT